MLNKKQWLGVALAYTLFVFVASLVSINVTIAPTIKYKDKIVHIGIYIIYTIVWYAYFNSNKQNPNYTKAILLAFTTGILIEILQGVFTINRTAETLDVVANSIGIALAILALKQSKFRNTLNLEK